MASTKKWLDDRWTEKLLPALQSSTSEEQVQQLSEEEKAYWRTRLSESTILGTAHTPMQKKISQAALAGELSGQIAEWAQTHFSFSAEQWQARNVRSGETLDGRLRNQKLMRGPDRIVEYATRLLHSSNWADIAIGLELVTGRRTIEILARGAFQPSTAYSVQFTGQAKKRDGSGELPYEIPTLCPAPLVIESLKHLRQIKPFGEEKTNEQIRAVTHRTLEKAATRHFENLIPTTDQEHKHIHLLRSAYARLAVFFYCPLTVSDISFLSEILGHDGYGSVPSYSVLKIATEDGAQIDGRQGVKLGIAGVEVLLCFQSKQDGASASYGASTGMVAAPVTTPREAQPMIATIAEQPAPVMLMAHAELSADTTLAELVRSGMEAAGVTDVDKYIKEALERRAKFDMSTAKRDSKVDDVTKLSMAELADAKKPAAAAERTRRAIAAIVEYNRTHAALERWYINPSLVLSLIGGRLANITAYIKEHQAAIDEFNTEAGTQPLHNRKPYGVKDVVTIPE